MYFPKIHFIDIFTSYSIAQMVSLHDRRTLRRRDPSPVWLSAHQILNPDAVGIRISKPEHYPWVS